VRDGHGISTSLGLQGAGIRHMAIATLIAARNFSISSSSSSPDVSISSGESSSSEDM
jgi:hypothetical protein